MIYHSARLLGYLCLGVIFGSVGQSLFWGQQEAALVQRVIQSAAGVFFLLLSLQGFVRILRGSSSHFSLLPNLGLEIGLRRIWPQIQSRKGLTRAAWGGLFTALLPCGWLHFYLAAALASGSALRGALILFFFWLGSLPAFSVLAWSLRNWGKMVGSSPRVLGQLKSRKRIQWMAWLLLVLGTGGLFVRGSSLLIPTNGSSVRADFNAGLEWVCGTSHGRSDLQRATPKL